MAEGKSIGIGIDMEELFEGVDWTTANLGELEQKWQQQLEDMERSNVEALLSSGDRSNQALPALKKALLETDAVERLLGEYGERLQAMGQPIEQIETLNRMLSLQSTNQSKLLAMLEQLNEGLVFGEQGLLERPALDDPKMVGPIAEAALKLAEKLQRQWGDLLMMRAVRQKLEELEAVKQSFGDHLVSFLGSAFRAYREAHSMASTGSYRKSGSAFVLLPLHDELRVLLDHYRPVVLALAELDRSRHAALLKHYQRELGELLRHDLSEFLNVLRSVRMVRQSAEERPYLFVSLGSSSLQERAVNIISMGQGRTDAVASDRDLAAIPLFDKTLIPELERNETLDCEQAIHYVVLLITLQMAQQQELLARDFFAVPPNTMPSEPVLRLVDATLGYIFAPMAELLESFLEAVTQLDNSTSLEILVALDLRIPQLSHELPVLARILQTIKRRQLVVGDQFISDQVSIIEASKYSARKRSGVFPFVALFPQFLSRLESGTLRHAPQTASARDVANRGYERITATIFRSLDVLAMQAERSNDEKERTNASVMNIQNAHFLVTQLKAIRATAVENSLKLARSRYEQHLQNYATLSLRRVIPELLTYFEALGKTLETIPAEEAAFQPNYNRASARRTIAQCPPRDIHRKLELLYQRIEKHYLMDTGARELVAIVWRAVQERFMQLSTLFSDTLRAVYGTGKDEVRLAYTAEEVAASFVQIESESKR